MEPSALGLSLERRGSSLTLDGRNEASEVWMTRIRTVAYTRMDRRTFLLANRALATRVAAQSPRLETFSQWLAASRETRDAALQPCIDRIRALDGDIQAWVQMLPQKPTGSGNLSGIPL